MRNTRSRLLTAVLMGTVLALFQGAAGTAIADSPTADAAMVPGTAVMSFGDPVAAGEGVVLSITLTDGDGTPVQRQPVEFHLIADFFGEQSLPIQTAFTNQDGVAKVTYFPSWNGEHHVTAGFAGSEGLQPSQTAAVLTVAELPATTAEEPAPLESVHRWAAPGAVAATLAVWLLLALILGRVGWGVWRTGRGFELSTRDGSTTPPQRLRGSTSL